MSLLYVLISYSMGDAMSTHSRQDRNEPLQEMTKVDVPRYHELMNPLLDALHELGGSGSIGEISEQVVSDLDLRDDVVEVLHNPEKSSQTEIEYRLAWSRTYLKKYGVIDNHSRGVWAIRVGKRDVGSVDPGEVVSQVREEDRNKRKDRQESSNTEEEEADVPEEARSWRTRLHRILTKEMEPAAFERLTKLLLRRSGFVQVEVTGQSGDGGVDGKGIMQIGGLLSFHVFFQCKRYQGSVSAHHVRDFRGAMAGRAGKGLLITTGTFTRAAKKEAKRAGATPIDLVDGGELTEKLKELELGVRTEKEVVENVEVKEDWFRNI